MSFEKKHTNWLITFFVYNNIYYELKAKDYFKGNLPPDYFSMREQTNFLFNTLENLPYNENITILIFHLEADYRSKSEDVNGVIAETLQVDKIEVTAIEKNIDGLEQKGAFLDLTVPLLTSSASFEKLFEYINRHYDFKHIMCVTHGHGCLFGINNTSEKLAVQLYNNATRINLKEPVPFDDFKDEHFAMSKQNHIATSIFDKTTQKLNKYFAWYKNNLVQTKLSVFFKEHKKETYETLLKVTMLTNKELADAIAQLQKRVDVLVMYNCLMQNIYSQYEFRKCVDYFVAPSSGIGFPGYDFQAVLTNMDSDSSPQLVAESFITTMGKSEVYKDFKHDIQNTLFVAAFTLNEKQLDSVKIHYDDWIKKLLNLLHKSGAYKSYLSRLFKNEIFYVYNLSADSIPQIKVVDFEVLLNKILLKLKNTNQILNSDKTELIDTTNKLLNNLNDIKRFNPVENEFYGVSKNESYTDLEYPEHRGIGVMLSRGAFSSKEIIELIFSKNQQHVDLTPSFLQHSKTQELIDLLNLQ